MKNILISISLLASILILGCGCTATIQDSDIPIAVVIEESEETDSIQLEKKIELELKIACLSWLTGKDMKGAVFCWEAFKTLEDLITEDELTAEQATEVWSQILVEISSQLPYSSKLILIMKMEQFGTEIQSSVKD